MKIVKSSLLLLMLALSVFCFISCDKVEEDENGLGASRPIYEDYGRSYKSLNGTKWSETINSVKTTLNCNASQCTFTYSNKPSATYNYSFEYGNVYFTPVDGVGDKLRGTFTLKVDYKDILYISYDTKNLRLHDLKREIF